MKKCFFSLTASFFVFFLLSPDLFALSNVAQIREGVPYYSDEYERVNGIVILGNDRNYEEVYQFYEYYEAYFDDKERIVKFNVYKKGALDHSEAYIYDSEKYTFQVFQHTSYCRTLLVCP